MFKQWTKEIVKGGRVRVKGKVLFGQNIVIRPYSFGTFEYATIDQNPLTHYISTF